MDYGKARQVAGGERPGNTAVVRLTRLSRTSLRKGSGSARARPPVTWATVFRADGAGVCTTVVLYDGGRMSSAATGVERPNVIPDAGTEVVRLTRLTGRFALQSTSQRWRHKAVPLRK